MLLAAHLLVTALFLVLGVVFSRGKGTSLIAGYNTASPEEKQNTMKRSSARPCQG